MFNLYISFICFLYALPDCEICQPELLLATYFMYTVRTVVVRVQTTLKYVRLTIFPVYLSEDLANFVNISIVTEKFNVLQSEAEYSKGEKKIRQSWDLEIDWIVKNMTNQNEAGLLEATEWKVKSVVFV